MVASSPAQLASVPRSFRLRDGLLLLAALAAAGTAAVFARSYASAQSNAEMAFWSTRLEQSAQAGARSLGQRLETQVAALAELADNASLRVYLWRLASDTEGADTNPAETDYLNSLLNARTDAGTRTRAPAFSSLLLVNPQLQPVAGTSVRALTPAEQQLAAQALGTRTRQLWLVADPAGVPQILQAMPVRPPPGGGDSVLAGVLLAENAASDFLRPVLANLPGYFANDTSLLVSSAGLPAVVLTGSPPYSELRDLPEPGFREVMLAGGGTVLQSTQRVPGTDWTLVRRIDGTLALSAVRQRIWARYLALTLAVIALVATLLAWRERSLRVAQSSQTLPAVSGRAGIGFAGGTGNPALNKLVASLIDVIDLHDPFSAFHSARLAELCGAMAADMGLEQQTTNHLVTAALLANIGKLSLPRELLTKRDELSQPEQTLLQSHVAEGVEILRKLEFDDPVLSAIAQKQETLDGSGYPQGIRADRITLPGRILALANAYVALVSPRAYREALSSADALDELRKQVGVAYDSEVFVTLERVIARGDALSDWESHPGAAG
ncbi:MAG: HD domain-containing phosphohydrolase [Gammaproteobacteria bacterium]|jgi:HD-GYP domain-containing protein (c-di-GMP phosphodiesterase class II)|nr:HD domain-containing phosphohydrolase [Gammaproteobacteria bacterium]